MFWIIFNNGITLIDSKINEIIQLIKIKNLEKYFEINAILNGIENLSYLFEMQFVNAYKAFLISSNNIELY